VDGPTLRSGFRSLRSLQAALRPRPLAATLGFIMKISVIILAVFVQFLFCQEKTMDESEFNKLLVAKMMGENNVLFNDPPDEIGNKESLIRYMMLIKEMDLGMGGGDSSLDHGGKTSNMNLIFFSFETDNGKERVVTYKINSGTYEKVDDFFYVVNDDPIVGALATEDGYEYYSQSEKLVRKK
jgi:hypothetical protein